MSDAVTSWLDAMSDQLTLGAEYTHAMLRREVAFDPTVVLATAEAVGALQGGGWGADLERVRDDVSQGLQGSEVLSQALSSLDLGEATLDLEHASDTEAQHQRLRRLVALGCVFRAFPSDAARLQRALERNAAAAELAPGVVRELSDAAGFYADVLNLTVGPLADLMDAVSEAAVRAEYVLEDVDMDKVRARVRAALFPPPILVWARAHAPGSDLEQKAESAAEAPKYAAAASADDFKMPDVVNLATRKDGNEQVTLLIYPGGEGVFVAWAGETAPDEVLMRPGGTALSRSVDVLLPDGVLAWAVGDLPDGVFQLELIWASGSSWVIDVPGE